MNTSYKFHFFFRNLVYTEKPGVCRNKDGRFKDIGTANVDSLWECQRKCDATQGCGAVSWDKSETCFMTSNAVSSTNEDHWICYTKG